jgi:arylsulfatase
MDFVPMALRAAGLDLPTDRYLDGRDPTDALAGEAPSPHNYICWSWGSNSAAIRMGRYKLLREKMSTNQEWQLFDLETDIGETANLRSAKQELVEQLIAEYERWEKDATTGR